MTENPFKPNTPIEKTSPKANEKLVGGMLGEEAVTQYAQLVEEREVENGEEEEVDLTLTLEEKDILTEVKRDTPESIQELLQKVGSPAELDTSFMGGIVSIDIPKGITDWETAIEAFTAADYAPELVWREWQKEGWTPPSIEHLDVIVLSYNNDQKTRNSSDRIVADMDRLGLRPLTLEEMVMLSIVEPRFTKTSEKHFVSLTKYERDGIPFVPSLWLQHDDIRRIDRNSWGSIWNDKARFLCVSES